MKRSKIFLAASASLLAIAGFAAKKAHRFQPLPACYLGGFLHNVCTVFGQASGATITPNPGVNATLKTANGSTLYRATVTRQGATICTVPGGVGACAQKLYDHGN